MVDPVNAEKLRVPGTAAVTVLVWSLLTWQHLEGGVPSHHLLARADLPAISNWWGALLLPALTWALLGRILGRVSSGVTAPHRAAAAFTGAGLFGVVLAVSFVMDDGTMATYMVRGLPLLALLLPLYRGEYVLGFVLGMTYTFGAVLPTGFAVAVSVMAWGLYRYVRPALLRIVYWRRGEPAALSPRGGQRSGNS